MAPRDYQGMPYGQMVWTVPPISMFFFATAARDYDWYSPFSKTSKSESAVKLGEVPIG